MDGKGGDVVQKTEVGKSRPRLMESIKPGALGSSRGQQKKIAKKKKGDCARSDSVGFSRASGGGGKATPRTTFTGA